MSVEWIAGIMVAISILCLGGATFLFFHQSWLMQWLRGTAGFLLAGGALYLSFLAASMFSYQQVDGDKPLATLSFEKKSDQLWLATVADAEGNRRQFELAGDLWELDVRLLRWRALFGGAAPGFQLDRLTSRYVTLEDESSKPHNEYSLASEPFLGFDLWIHAREGSLLAEGSLGSVVLVPMAAGAIYEVVMGDEGLAVHPANSVAENALSSVTGIAPATPPGTGG